MPEKSISEQIIDEFIDKVVENEILSKKKLDALKDALQSDDIDKARIESVLKEDESDENP